VAKLVVAGVGSMSPAFGDANKQPKSLSGSGGLDSVGLAPRHRASVVGKAEGIEISWPSTQILPARAARPFPAPSARDRLLTPTSSPFTTLSLPRIELADTAEDVSL
jgi:hypothetical protein